MAYVLFATGHPAHFAVMRAPGLVPADDPGLVAARGRAGAALRAGAGRMDRDPATPLAGWALVHGLSALLIEGTIAPESDVAALARVVTERMCR